MTLLVEVKAFGIKYRPMTEAQLVLDARVLDNPARIDRMRPLTGLDADVAAYVLGQPLARQLLSGATIIACAEIVGALTRKQERVVFSIYSTSGKHRSVALAEDLLRRLHLSFPDRDAVVFSGDHLDITNGREASQQPDSDKPPPILY